MASTVCKRQAGGGRSSRQTFLSAFFLALLALLATNQAYAQATDYTLDTTDCGDNSSFNVAIEEQAVITDICTSETDTYSFDLYTTLTVLQSGGLFDIRVGLLENSTSTVVSSDCLVEDSTSAPGVFGNLDNDGDCNDLDGSAGDFVTGIVSVVDVPCSGDTTYSAVVGWTTSKAATYSGTDPISGSGNQNCFAVGGTVEPPQIPVFNLTKVAFGDPDGTTFTPDTSNTSMPSAFGGFAEGPTGVFTSGTQKLFLDAGLVVGDPIGGYPTNPDGTLMYVSGQLVTISEVDPTGWIFDDITCTLEGVEVDADATTATVIDILSDTLSDNQVYDCTITNRQTSDLTLNKSVDNLALTLPEDSIVQSVADAWDLTWVRTDGDMASGEVNPGGSVSLINGVTYTLGEEDDDDGADISNNGNYILTDVSCTGTIGDAVGVDLGVDNGLTVVTNDDGVVTSVSYTPQASVTDAQCTFTNTINVAKVTLNKWMVDPAIAIPPEFGPTEQQFTLSLVGATVLTGTVSDTVGTWTDAPAYIEPGTGITATEVVLAGSNAENFAYQTQFDCSVNGVDGTQTDAADFNTSGTEIFTGTLPDVAAGESILCTFENQPQVASIALRKNVDPTSPALPDSLNPKDKEFVLTATGVTRLDGVGTSGVEDSDATDDFWNAPILVSPATGVTVSEAISATPDNADKFNYAIELVCRSGTTVLSQTLTSSAQTLTSGAFDIENGDEVVCDFKNRPLVARINLAKTVKESIVPLGDNLPEDWEFTLAASNLTDLATGNPLTGFEDTYDTASTDPFWTDTGYFVSPTSNIVISETDTNGGFNYNTSVTCTNNGLIDEGLAFADGTILEADGTQSLASFTIAAGDDISCTFENQPQVASIQLVKSVLDADPALPNDLQPVDDEFALTVSNVTALLGDALSGVESVAWDDPVLIAPADGVIVSEALVDSAPKAKNYVYNGSVECLGQTSPVVNLSYEGIQSYISGIGLNIEDGDAVVCTFKNTPQTAKVTVTKGLISSDTHAEFGISSENWIMGAEITGGAAIPDQQDPAAPSQNAIYEAVIPAGTNVTVFETPDATGLSTDATRVLNNHYSVANITCSNQDDYTFTEGDETASFVADAGAMVDCLIENQVNLARLTLAKDLTIPEGTSFAPDAAAPEETDFTLTASGAASEDIFDTSLSGTESSTSNWAGGTTTRWIVPGEYTIIESDDDAYTYTSVLDCVGAADADPADGLNIQRDENVTCTWDNTLNTGTLQLVKSVAANSLGVDATDWNLSYAGVTVPEINNGSGVPGIGAAGADGDVAVEMILPAGTFTIMEAKNNTDTALDAFGVQELSCVATPSDLSDEVQSILPDPSQNESDSVTLANGETVRCEWVNEPNKALITLEKTLTTPPEALAALPTPEADWVLTATGAGTDSQSLVEADWIGGKFITPGADGFALSEAANAGDVYDYTTSISCTYAEGSVTDPDTNPLVIDTAEGTIPAVAGDNITCVFTNELDTATVSITKSVDNGAVGLVDGVTEDAEAWFANLVASSDHAYVVPAADLNWEDAATSSTVEVVVPTGTYTLSEALDGDATATAWPSAYVPAIDCGTGVSTEDGTSLENIVFEKDTAYECTVTNTLQTATLQLAKSVRDPLPGVTPEDWAVVYDGLLSNGPDGALGTTGEPIDVPAGVYVLTEIAQGTAEPETLYQLDNLTCEITHADDSVSTEITSALPGSVSLADGDAAVCTFTNAANKTKLTLVKEIVTPDSLADLPQSADLWSLTADDLSLPVTLTSGVWAVSEVYVEAGELVLKEEAPASETLVFDASVVCEGTDGTVTETETPDNWSVTTLPGEDVTCTFKNTLETVTLALVNTVDNGAATQDLAVASDWDLLGTETASGFDTGTTFDNGGSLTGIVVPVGTYDLSQLPLSGSAGTNPFTENYVLASITCEGSADTDGLDGLALTADDSGATVICTYEQVRETSELTIVVNIINDDGGTGTAGEFTIDYSQGTVPGSETGETRTIAADQIVLTPSDLGGYVVDLDPAGTNGHYTLISYDCGDGVVTVADDTVPSLTFDAESGLAYTCTFVLDDNGSDYSLTKTVDTDGTGAVGDVLNYTYTFENAGPWPIYAVGLTSDSLVEAAGDSLEFCAIDVIAPGDSDICSYSYTLTAADLDGEGLATVVDAETCESGLQIVNDATATAKTTPDGDQEVIIDGSVSSSASSCIQKAEPAYTLAKTVATDGTGAVGDVLTFTYTFTNTSLWAVYDVGLASDSLVEAAGDSLDFCAIDVIAPGGEATCDYLYTITQADLDGTGLATVTDTGTCESGLQIVNSAVGTAKTRPGGDVEVLDAESVSSTASSCLEPQKPAYTFVKSVDAVVPLSEGDVATYSFTVTNSGNVTLNDIVVTDQGLENAAGPVTLMLSAGTLVDAAPSGDSLGDAGAGTWTSLAPGDAAVFTASYTVTEADQLAAGAAGGAAFETLTNTAVATSSFGGEELPITNSSADIAIVPLVPPTTEVNIEVMKTADVTTVNRGGVVTYTILVSETTGNSSATGAVVDTLPDGFSLIEVTQSGGATVSEDASGRVITFSGLVVPAKGTVTLVYTARVGAHLPPGDYTNVAVFEGADPGQEIEGTLADTATVKIAVDRIFDCSDVIGKVFVDENRNGYQDAGETGLPGARVLTVGGEIITVDGAGRFHVPCALLPNHRIGSNIVLKLDTHSLPTGYQVTTENPRSTRLTAGKMAEVNFGVAVGRTVEIMLTDEAFEPGRMRLTEEVRSGLAGFIENYKDQFIELDIFYDVGDQTRAFARSRLRSALLYMRGEWRQFNARPLRAEFHFIERKEQ